MFQLTIALERELRRLRVEKGLEPRVQIEKRGLRWQVIRVGDSLYWLVSARVRGDCVLAGPFWRKRTALVHLEIHRAL